MEREKAFSLFGRMNRAALAALTDYTKNNVPQEQRKEGDRSIFSKADIITDEVLCGIARLSGLRPIGEESETDLQAIGDGNYITIDSIDGSGLYLEHVKSAAKKELATAHFDPDLGDNFDYAVILGIVENGKPRFGSYFSYVTGETIMVDSDSTIHTLWDRANNSNNYEGRTANYIENRVIRGAEDWQPHNTEVNERISQSAISELNVGPLGRRCLYAQLGEHESSAVYHMGLQENGLLQLTIY